MCDVVVARSGHASSRSRSHNATGESGQGVGVLDENRRNPGAPFALSDATFHCLALSSTSPRCVAFVFVGHTVPVWAWRLSASVHACRRCTWQEAYEQVVLSHMGCGTDGEHPGTLSGCTFGIVTCAFVRCTLGARLDVACNRRMAAPQSRLEAFWNAV